jgi:zinc transporter, ZIP family
VAESVMLAAFWGGLAAMSLIIGAVVAIRLQPSERTTGAVMGFGAGALLGGIAYELVPESLVKGAGWEVLVAFAAGALAFFLGDWLIDQHGGQHRKRIASEASEASRSDGGSGMAIFLGTLLDGIPESLVLGIGLALGSSVSVGFLAAVFVSNIPEGMAGTSSLISEGHSWRQVYRMWIALVIASAAAAALGYAFARTASSVDSRVVQGFAAGAVLTMLADTMMPEAFKHGGKVVGLLTTLGFLMTAILSVLE